MTARRAACAAAALGAATILLAAAPASAHALLRASEPAEGARLEAPPAAVTLELTEPPEPGLSSITVAGPGGAPVHRGEAAPLPDDPSTVRVALGDLEEGVYTVTWHVVSRIDGHPSAGTFSFGVGVDPGAAPPAAAVAPPVSPLEVAARAALFLGLGVLLGSSWVGALAFPRPPRAVVRLALAAAGVAMAATVAFALAQARAAGVSVAALGGTSVGRALILRAAGAGIALVAVASSARMRRLGLLVAGAAAAGAMLVHVAAGHAAADRLGTTRIAAQWVHVVAASVWLGGLGALLAGVRGEPDETKGAAVRRFSLVAGAALAAVAGTGVVRALDEVGGWGALFGSAYGRLAAAKAGLLLALATLGARNRFRSVPAASSDLRGLRRVSRGELAFGLLALTAAAAMASLVPPAAIPALAGPRAPISMAGSDFSKTVRVRLDVTPGLPGPNRFSIRVTEEGSDEPVAGARASLRFAAAGRPDASPTTLALRHAGEGIYAASGNLAAPGAWEVVAVVQREAEGFEVPFEIRTICRTKEVEAPPPRPSVHLSEAPDGGSVEGYLLPLDGGVHEVHFTFLDPEGAERNVPSPPEVVATGPEGHPELLEVFALDAGHFVAEAELTEGRWRFDAAGSDERDTPLFGCFEQRVPG